MATRASINFDFNRAMTQAARLEELAASLQNVSQQQLVGALVNISAGWKGENASRYLAKGSVLKDNMINTAGGLRQLAGEIRTIAKRIYDAEMRALAIAESRTYR